MNRFRTKKKGKDDSPGPRPSIESESSSPFRMFGKNKKGQEEDAKPDVDLSNVLPPSDDFRTSLLMTGLSARFSMLREQDDPNTKVGKASDDSVLFSKRQSKMADFGHTGGLQDICEVESIRAHTFNRLDSFQSEDASSTSSSIMNRCKPNEGNNLFGGRQKIYRIPANNSGPSKNGGMPGRALYDDDVAMSSFQKWRLAGKERQSEEAKADGAVDADPPQDFNRRRETSSTTSSTPSIAARHSTASTSVHSQGASSIKESQSPSTAPNTSSSSAAGSLERSFTRTRRLYEQGLSRDLHNQQSSALSRMDTLSKGRAFGSLAPDLTSPTNNAVGDRVLERRPIISKASAPNLRSYTPPVSSASRMSPAENSSKFLQTSEPKANLGANPPLSPPASESEDHLSFPIQPNDRGKATAMGPFERPAQRYDDSKYTQRQRQLQQGHDIPTNRFPVRSSTLATDIRSRSTSSAQRQRLEKTESVLMRTNLIVPKETQTPSMSDDSDDSSMMNQAMSSGQTPQLSLERPDDDDHPAFRKSALPTPLSLAPKPSGSLSPLSEKHNLSQPTIVTSADSPTLGPNSGLNGMVRAHLRSNSTTSSMDGTAAQAAEPQVLNGGAASGRGASPASSVSGRQAVSEKDDFARHLADGARRVRERLGSYVDTDADRSPLTLTQPSEASKELNPPRSNALGILRSKSSRGSLFDRDQSQPRSIKTVKSSSSVAGLSPSRKTSADATEEGLRGRSTQSREQASDEGTPCADKDDGVHVGLKAFRQARRELQKLKEMETKQRYQPGSGPERPPMSTRATAQDASGPPPAMFNRMPREDSGSGSGSRARSRAGSRAPSERDRSGSGTSNSGQPQMRPMRMRNGPAPHDGPHAPGSPSGGARARLAGPPGVRQRSYEAGQWPPMNFSSGSLPFLTEARQRNGSLIGATASTPNLHASMGAPPLPPINPRRKTGLARPGDDDAPLVPARMPGGFPGSDDGYGGLASDDEGAMEQHRLRLRRATSEGNSLSGRARYSPRNNDGDDDNDDDSNNNNNNNNRPPCRK